MVINCASCIFLYYYVSVPQCQAASISLLNFGFAKSKETTTSNSGSREETESSIDMTNVYTACCERGFSAMKQAKMIGDQAYLIEP